MSEIGLEKNEIDTPALLIDLDLMEKNISKMSHFFADKKAKLRAHTKVHRTPILAHKQIRAGAKGICCQKLAEAEIMAASGINDIMVTNEIVTPKKINRLIALTKYADISVIVDNVINAEQLSKAALREGAKLNVLVDIHTGSNRCGVESGEPAFKLTKRITELKGLSFMGLMNFEGHLSSLEPRDRRKLEIEKSEGILLKTKEVLEKSGIEVREVSTGSTGTYDVSGVTPGVTEVQAGSYILMDAGYHPHTPEFDCALSVLSTVISRPSEYRVICDSGLMSMHAQKDSIMVSGRSDLRVGAINAENTRLEKDKPIDLSVGDQVEFIPSYLDGTVKLHEKFYGVRKGKVECIWNILGRDTSN